MHKWRPKKYSSVFVLISLTNLVSMDKIQKKSSFRTRLVGLISTRMKEYFFGRHLCIRSTQLYIHKMQVRNIAGTTNKLHVPLEYKLGALGKKNKSTNTGEKGPLKIKHHYYYFYLLLNSLNTFLTEFLFNLKHKQTSSVVLSSWQPS